MKDVNGVELVAQDNVKYLGHSSDLGDLIHGKTYKVRYTTRGLMVQLYDVPHLVNPWYLSKVVDEKDTLVEITQSEYDELHEELALKDSLIGDLQDELKKLRGDMVAGIPNKGIVLGSEVVLREDSKWNDGRKTNPLGVVGKVIEIEEYEEDELPVIVQWEDSFENAYHYRDLDVISNV